MELIETLWNVNVIYDPSAYCADLGINRNIVECKLHKQPLRKLKMIELIETLWNVNRKSLKHG